MKRILLLLFILSSSISFTFAQTIKYTVIAGLNESTASDIPDRFIQEVASYGETFPNSRLLGYHVGVLGEYQFGRIFIQSGLIYTTKGGIPYSSSVKVDYNNYSRKEVMRLNYLEIPLDVLYKMSVGNSKIFIGAGPYFAAGISGRQTSTDIENNLVNKRSDKIYYGDDIKRMDYGLNAKLGLILRKKWTIGLTYDYGLNDISTYSRFSGENKSLSLSLGYSFQ